MVVRVENGQMTEDEKNEYVKFLRKKYPGRDFSEIVLKIDGEYIDIQYEYSDPPFDRIRRITGYLVGSMDRWNSAKRAEENDRLKHDPTDIRGEYDD